ncbi:prepilin peptidase [bacterium]|nr:prepilin peptidase [bacterium]
MTLQYYIILACTGLAIGSFLNVVIYRLPRKLSLAGPRSMCPSCGETIRFYDNIPVLSFMLLRGKCRHCQAVICWRYPIVELLTAGLLLIMAKKFGFSADLLKYGILCLVLIPISFIDWDEKIIPNWLTFSGFILGILVTMVFQIDKWSFMLLGLVTGGVFMTLLMVLGKVIFRKDAMGMGDVKLLIMTGVYVGIPGVIMGVYLGAVAALIVIAIPLILKKIKFGEQIPFGPFIAMGTVLHVLIGPDLISWYRELITG